LSGFLHTIQTEPLYTNQLHALLAIVEFADSPIKLEGLLHGWFPVLPVTKTIHQVIIGEHGI